MRRVTSAGLTLIAALVAGLATACNDSPTEPSRTPAVALATADNGAGMSITTDKDDYSPGDTVQFIGAGWPANDVLDIALSDDAGDLHEWTINVEADGTFRDSTYVVDTEDLGVTFTLTATSRATGESLTVTFFDGSLSSGSIEVREGTCSTAQTTFVSGATVCAQLTLSITGGGNTNFWVQWIPPAGTRITHQKSTSSTGTNVSANDTQVANVTGSWSVVLCASDPGTGTCAGPQTKDTETFTVLASNQAPTADPGGPYTGDEGEVIQLDGSGSSDPEDGTDITYLWSVDVTGNVSPYVAIDAGGECKYYTTSDASDAGTTTSTLQKPYIKCTDDGVFKVTLVVTDKGSPSLSSTPVSTQLTVNNVVPSVSITAPGDYSVWAITASQLGSLGFVSASFSDDGTNDTHTCTIDWGEGTTSTGSVTETAGAGTCTSPAITNPYTDNGAGIYTITVKVTDDDTGEGTASVTIVVYDPDAGFVTGGGWINSLAGYCKLAACAGAEGKANFGFVSKYKKGASVPTGQTEFQFQAGNLNFHSESYEWLVVNQAGTTAQYKGVGTINGQACYDDVDGKCRFMLWGKDGTKTGDADTFRISIWTEDSGGNKTYVYDNGSGSGFSSNPIAGGSIQVQTGGKK